MFPCDRASVQNYYRPPTVQEITPGNCGQAMRTDFARVTLQNSASSRFTSIGDIRVVGAVGDFMMAGTGALAEELSESGTDFRGASFATGRRKKCQKAAFPCFYALILFKKRW